MVTRWPSTGPTTVSSIELSGSRPQLRRRSSISPLLHPISCTESAAEPSSPEQAMIAQQTMMKDALSPHAPNSISAFVAPKTENQVPGGGLCPLRRISTLRSTRQDAQINYLSTLSIFMKQTTYLATLPNPNLKANECPCF